MADLQSYGESALTLGRRLLSVAQTWVRPPAGIPVSVLVATGAGATAVLLLACILVLRTRARRETRKLREELAKQIARTQAVESANEAKAEFLASMSHQIRTPMNAIVGFTALALKTQLDPKLRDYLDTVRASADWLSHIANDVLEFSRVEVGRLELDNRPFSISECILSSMKIVEPDAVAKKLVTGCKIDPQLPEMVCGDPARLRHVIFNLLDNAVRFTTNGSVILSAALESDSADDVLVRVSVTDTGFGIPPAKLPLIFEPFRHADAGAASKRGATGLGLAISRRLVDLMGGKMDFQSQLGAGSTFEFTVRLQKNKTPGEVDAPVHTPERVGPKELSILVAEDNAVSLHLVTKVLESAGHRVWTAVNGKEAAQNFQTEAFDLILMDLEMPDIDGFEATQAIRAAEAPGLHVPIYALTAHALPAYREKCFAVGMDGFLTKPIAAEEVLQLVSKLAVGPGNTRSAINADVVSDLGEKAPIPTANEYVIPAENALIPEYVELETVSAIDSAGHGTNGEESSANFCDSEFAFEVMPSNVADDQPCVSEVPASFAGSPDDEEAWTVNSSPYLLPMHLLPMPAATEANHFSGASRKAVNAEVDGAGVLDIDKDCGFAIDAVAKILIADSDENALQEVHQSAKIISILAGMEASYGNSDDRGPAARARLSAPAGLALLEATRQLNDQSPSLAKQNDGPIPISSRDPFEQARKSLSKSRFDVRVIHNDGDPSDRNLI